VATKASGLVGFIRFTSGFYLILIKKHKKVGRIGHHNILSIESTILVPLSADASKEEKGFMDQFNKFNLCKDFYFSYSYELSRTMQQNLADAKRASHGQALRPLYLEKDTSKHHRFVWNHFHMTPFLQKEGWQHWCLPIIHGFFAQTRCSSFGWSFSVALIARRSRFYAGTRYRKRGLNVDGQVGNDVETEQLLCDESTRHLACGHVMSFVQIRGSVPLFWSQEAAAYNPKPPVVYPRCDPTLSATRRHFADLLERYGTPQLVVNLMKAKKVDSYEVRLSKHFESAIERMNRELPPEHRILYRPFDMKNHAKSNSAIFEVFSRLAESAVSRVGFFHTKMGLQGMPEKLQTGVVRTNCVDCLDRTNVLQFFVGLEVLKQQLTAMSWLPEPKMDFECQAVLVLSELYDVMGDHVALQYAGSIAHKKYQLLGSRPRMMPTSQELLTSIHRHYNNSFTDREKQACLNLFLGLYQPAKHPPMEKLDCDNWLHHKILKDDYNPGDWWMEPLQNYKQKMEPLMSKGSQYQVDLSHDLQDWFRQVHKAHKYTYFEKLLANVEATFTFVQVNTGQRPLRVTGVYKNRKMMKAKNKEETSTECPQSFPSPLSPKVKEAYRAYADSHLNQLIRGTQFDESVLRPTFQPLSLDTEEAYRRPENTKKQGVKSNPLLQSQKARALFKDMRSLLEKCHEKQKVSSKSRIADPQEQKLSARLRRMREKTMNTQMNQDPKDPTGSSMHSNVQESNSQAGLAVVPGSSVQPKSQFPSRRSQSRSSHGASSAPGKQSSLGLCRYCDSFYQVEVNPQAASDPIKEKFGPKMARICPRHSHRAEKLIEFLNHSTYSSYSHLNGDDRARKERQDPDPQNHIHHITINVSGANSDRPWTWLSTPDRTLRPRAERAESTLRDGSKNRNLTAPPSPEGDRKDDSRDARHSATAAGVPLKTFDLNLLWTYIFPHEPPDKAKADDLGLPRWYMDLTTAPPVVAQESPQPVIRTRSLPRSEGRKTRRNSHPHLSAHVRTPSAMVQAGSSPKADASGGVGRSIFAAENVQQALEDLETS